MGDTSGKAAAKESTEQSLKSFIKYLPEISKLVQEQYGPDSLAQLEAAKGVSGGYTELAKLENQANIQNATETLTGSGGGLAKSLTEIQNQLDPDFAKARTGVTQGLLDIDKSYDLSGLSSGEAAAAERALSKGTLASGNLGSGGALELAKNMQGFGEAFNKKRQAKSANLGLLGQLAPSFKSGMSAAGMVPSVAGVGGGYGAYQGVGSGGPATANNLLSSIFGTGNAAMGQKSPAVNALNTGVGIAGGLLGGLLCWVAREVYGEDNPRWELFRSWLIEDAPAWFRNLYKKHGERFAAFISNKPALKYLIRVWMDGRINNKFPHGHRKLRNVGFGNQAVTES